MNNLVASACQHRKAARMVLYEDNRFMVTTADIRTPTTYYPIGETVGRIRRDVLFAALAYAVFAGAALAIYFDLWLEHEKLLMGLSIAIAVLVGSQVSILQLDARGFPPRMFFARSKTVHAVFDAITQARAKTANVGYFDASEDIGTN